MMERDDDVLLMLLAILASDADDDFTAELLHRTMKRWAHRRERSWSPELEELFMMLPRRGSRTRRRMEEARGIAQSVVDGFQSAFEPRVREDLGHVREAIDGLSAQVKDATGRVVATEQELVGARSELHAFLWATSCGVNLAEAELVRFVPSRLYVGDPLPDSDRLARLVEALRRFAGTLDLLPSEELPEESGSWWKKLFFKTKELATHPEVRDTLEAGKRALHGACEKPQADVNKCQAEAAAALIAALKETKCACIQLGSLLLIKCSDADSNTAVVCRTLTPEELRRLEEKQTVLSDPSRILAWLESGEALPTGGPCWRRSE